MFQPRDSETMKARDLTVAECSLWKVPQRTLTHQRFVDHPYRAYPSEVSVNTANWRWTRQPAGQRRQARHATGCRPEASSAAVTVLPRADVSLRVERQRAEGAGWPSGCHDRLGT